jgi:hypothetical protein
MPMNEPEEGFEQYLRQFRPVMPCALSAPPRRSVPWGALAVAAAMLVVIGVAVLRHNLSPVLTLETQPRTVTRLTPARRAAMPRSVTIGELDVALRRSDHDFNQFLSDASPRILPHQHRGTALYELSKE